MSRVPSSTARLILASLMISGLVFAGAAFAGSDAGSVNFVLGYKNLSSDWHLEADAGQDPGRVSQPAMGVEITWGRQSWPARIALDVMHSYDDGITRVPAFFTEPPYDLRRRARTIEIGLGVRRSWTVIGLTPHVGAGGSWARGSVVVESSDPNSGQFGAPTASVGARASAFGFWAGGGIYRPIGPRFQIGLTGRYSRAALIETRLVLDGTTPLFVAAPRFQDSDGKEIVPKVDLGGRQINLVVGWSFPSRK